MKIRILFILAVLLLLPQFVDAQCSMCRAVLETDTDQNAARGINNGIVYLMAFPYLLVAGIGYFVYRSRKNAAKSEEE